MLRDPNSAAKSINDRLQGQKRKTTQSCSSEARLRLACNRCHAQKLRCLRSEGAEPGSKCERCRRASVPCVYSPPNRIGRPARSGLSSTTSSAGSSKPDGPGSPRNAPRRSSSNSPLPPSPQPLFISHQGTAVDSLADDSGMFDFHMDESNVKVDMLSFYHDNTPFLEGPAALLAENISMQGEISQNITISSCTNGTSDVSSGDRFSTTEIAPDNHVRELTAFGLAQYDQLRRLERMRNCTGNDKRGVFARLHNYPIHDMLEQVRRLTELITQLMSVPEYKDGPGGESIPDVDSSCLLNEESITNDLSNMLTPQFSGISYLSSSDNSSRLSLSIPSKPTPIDTSTILLFVACYLRLARAFAWFFTDLHTLLLFPSVVELIPSEERRIFPGLKLGSFQSYVGVGLEISIVVQVSERMLHRLHDSLGLSWNQCGSEGLFNAHLPTGAWSNADTITPVMMKAIQAQERIDAQDERGDTFTRLLLIMENVKGLIKTQPLL
ncbi:hypothetical protein MGYG_01497 [Nannizzia gypsea CBS 118893]|uniref:Zn(2)-C6 fungal-type domain-containing protein n=1 Tax=Arthroderma gypseum (strain ATCC MYA-4604 / CBS 118893) TaxID=535722 RepID=E5R180_ARTGP|nr:hypothetical protein MGYG_01497 [Nannizzia gypsea CBS 118893]EFQ98469.1 hypothetical protein MGYG_01497 [Nannizzia gypsea CBS 118893]